MKSLRRPPRPWVFRAVNRRLRRPHLTAGDDEDRYTRRRSSSTLHSRGLDVGAMVGTSTGAVHYYFPGKSEVLTGAPNMTVPRSKKSWCNSSRTNS